MKLPRALANQLFELYQKALPHQVYGLILAREGRASKVLPLPDNLPETVEEALKRMLKEGFTCLASFSTEAHSRPQSLSPVVPPKIPHLCIGSWEKGVIEMRTTGHEPSEAPLDLQLEDP